MNHDYFEYIQAKLDRAADRLADTAECLKDLAAAHGRDVWNEYDANKVLGVQS